jgi:hypothetical protein
VLTKVKGARTSSRAERFSCSSVAKNVWASPSIAWRSSWSTAGAVPLAGVAARRPSSPSHCAGNPSTKARLKRAWAAGASMRSTWASITAGSARAPETASAVSSSSGALDHRKKASREASAWVGLAPAQASPAAGSSTRNRKSGETRAASSAQAIPVSPGASPSPSQARPWARCSSTSAGCTGRRKARGKNACSTRRAQAGSPGAQGIRRAASAGSASAASTATRAVSK